ncbi:unnamed protein product [Heligmosomoides polygyrus]|uniref:MULE domain-containing protein n=1 Tax=Heligmosomoides polygyrus TaxID=6339 RepID=A0A183F4D6_HELPZ|nr:unnamed protein product [Heligmosomoides polygyrus]
MPNYKERLRFFNLRSLLYRRVVNDLTFCFKILKGELKLKATFIAESGKRYLERYGGRGLVFDDTFNVTRYSFLLATFMVTGDAENGFPSAFLLSYRMTSNEVQVLFRLVKEIIPYFDTQFFITADTYVFYNVFIAVFPSSKVSKMLCSFHMLQSLKRKQEELLKVRLYTEIDRQLPLMLIFRVRTPH